MPLTPEDRDRIRRDFVETPTSRLVDLSPEEEQALERAIEEEEAGKAENIAWVRRLEARKREDSILGAIHRGFEDANLSYANLSSLSGLTIDRLRDIFWNDTADLSGNEIDQLAKALRLRLVPMQVSQASVSTEPSRMPQAV